MCDAGTAPTGNPSILTHVPTGASLGRVSTGAAARRLAATLAALPVDWAEADRDRLKTALTPHMAPDPAAWLASAVEAATPARAARPTLLGRALAGAWKGATVTDVTHDLAELSGNCRGGCTLPHVEVMRDVRGRGHRERRHLVATPCTLLTLRGATAIIRK